MIVLCEYRYIYKKRESKLSFVGHDIPWIRPKIGPQPYICIQPTLFEEFLKRGGGVGWGWILCRTFKLLTLTKVLNDFSPPSILASYVSWKISECFLKRIWMFLETYQNVSWNISECFLKHIGEFFETYRNVCWNISECFLKHNRYWNVSWN